MYLKVVFIALTLCLSLLPLQGQDLYFHHLTVNNGLPHNTINAITEDKYGFIWIVTMESLCRFDGYKVVTYYSDNSPNSLPDQRPIRLFRDSNGDIWISFSLSNQVCKYNYITNDFSRYDWDQLNASLQHALSQQESYRTTRISNSDSLSWKIEDNQLIQTNHKTGKEYIYPDNSFEEGGLTDSYVHSVFLDSKEMLWVGTDNSGVYYADVNKKIFRHYTYEPNNSVRAICVDNTGQIWVGTRNNGIIRMNRTRSSCMPFHYFPENSKQPEESKKVRKIYKDNRGDIWIGTRNGLYHYNSQTTEINHFTTTTQPSIPHNWVYAINEDKNGMLWIGTWEGIACIDNERKSITSYPLEGLNSVRSIANDKNDGLWIASERGLFYLQYDIEAGVATNMKTTHYKNDKNDVHSINNDLLYAVDVDEDGHVWIGSARGVCMYDVNAQKIIRFPMEDYISDIGIRGVLCYKDYVWISYGKGITRLNRKNFSTRHYDRFDGLQQNEFSEDAYYKNPETGELFFGGNNGFNSFFPDSIIDNKYQPHVVATGLKIRNKPVQVGQEIKLTHLNKDFELEFSALHYSNPHKNRYAYKLEKFDEEWIPVSSLRRSAIYSGLPAGDYTLKVKASNCDGLWSEHPLEMKITVLPPWWFSGIAYTMYILLSLTISILIIKSIISRKNLKHSIQIEKIKAENIEEMSRIKSSFFTNISHELRTPVTLIIDPLRKLIEETEEKEEVQKTYNLMYRNAVRLLNLINQLLDFRKLETSKQTLHPSSNNIISFLRKTLNMFEFAARQKNITLKLSVTEKDRMLVFDENVLDKILVNLLSNAIKYSPDNTAVTVELSDIEEESTWFTVRVIDEGIGIAPDMQEKIFDSFYRIEDNRDIGSGIGLALVKELVHLHKGYITVDSTPSKGSCFTVKLPLNLQPVALSLNNDFEKDMIMLPFSPENEDREENAGQINDKTADLPLLLIVEDNDDIRNYIKESLSGEYNVITSPNGQEGWEKALEVIPDLIVSDIMMPVLSGIELCERLKTDERTSHIPVILLTARQSDESRIEGYETGADDYISKPFNSVLLKVRIKNLIDSRLKLRMLFSSTTSVELKKISVNSVDEKFINRAVDLTNLHIADTDFTPDIFAREMGVSRAQLFRKIKAMTNQTVHEFVTTIRLNKAAELLLTTDSSIGEIGMKCGFSEPSHFTRSFMKKFGITPSNYIKNNQ